MQGLGDMIALAHDSIPSLRGQCHISQKSGALPAPGGRMYAEDFKLLLGPEPHPGPSHQMAISQGEQSG